mmetsp:Transcript_42705/g.69434  ORF Transcript_42705/g.69434 Transcript_42705/m.69434 type:complete len:93 (+) Transcript_42705:703-981(+)
MTWSINTNPGNVCLSLCWRVLKQVLLPEHICPRKITRIRGIGDVVTCCRFLFIPGRFGRLRNDVLKMFEVQSDVLPESGSRLECTHRRAAHH